MAVLLLQCEQILPLGSAGITLTDVSITLSCMLHSGTALAAMARVMGLMEQGSTPANAGSPAAMASPRFNNENTVVTAKGRSHCL
jgi:hypothetical protein